MAWQGHSMQQGSIIQAERRSGPDAWEFRWREPGPDGKRKHRRMVIGRIDQLVDESAARGRIAALHLDINFWGARLKGKPLTISELAEHYRQRELKPDTVWKTYSTKLTYEGYLRKWILLRQGQKSHECSFQPRNTTRHLRSQSNSARATECEAEEDPGNTERPEHSKAASRASASRTDACAARRRNWFANERTACLKVAG